VTEYVEKDVSGSTIGIGDRVRAGGSWQPVINLRATRKGGRIVTLRHGSFVLALRERITVQRPFESAPMTVRVWRY
jgi:hypothetical protein